MEKIKKFIDCYVPIYACNLKCNYCYISTWENNRKECKSKKINYSPKFIRKALSKQRWNGPLMLNFCAEGETLLCKELIPIIVELLEEGHYAMIVTNGTISSKFDELVNLPEEIKRRLFIKFSYHYLELKRLNLLEKFFSNVNKMKKAGISFTIELTPSDEYIPYIDEIKETCIEHAGAMPHITVCRIENGNVPLMTKLDKEKFIKIWSTFNSALFDFKIKIFGKKIKDFCYAGAWTYTLSLVDGKLRQCYRGKVVQNIYKNINSPIKEIPIGCNCNDAHCWNGHAFLAFGDIPEMITPTFEEERNRHTKNGPWITKDMSEFMCSKLYETNKELDDKGKRKFNRKSHFFSCLTKLKSKIKKLKKMSLIILILLILIGLSISLIFIHNKTLKNSQEDKIVHISIDDTIEVFNDLTNNENIYKSIFENDMLEFLKYLHDEYGAKFSLYVFGTINDIYLSECTDKFKQEFIENSDWLTFGFHAYDRQNDYSLVTPEKMIRDYKLVINELKRIVGEESITNLIRLERFIISEENAVALKKEVEYISFLGTDTKYRKNYYLNDAQTSKMFNDDYYYDNKNKIFIFKTDFRIENMNEASIEDELLKESNNDLIIFTHEKFLKNIKDNDLMRKKMIKICSYVNEKGYVFKQPNKIR